METKSYGHSHNGKASAFATWWESGNKQVSFNLSDSTGEHARTGNESPEILALCDEALENARVALLYALERRRDTPLESLRYAFLVTMGRGGHTVYHDERADCSSHTEGYGLTAEELAEIDRLQIPFVDTRTVPDAAMLAMLRLPMWPSKPNDYDPAPWGGMSFAPIPVVAWLYQRIGATVKHIEVREPRPEELRSMSKGEATALKGWMSGSTTMVAEGMFLCRSERA